MALSQTMEVATLPNPGKLGSVVNVMDYKPILGPETGVAATDQAIALINRGAFNAAVADFNAALFAGRISTRFEGPPALFLMATQQVNGANYIGGGKGWSSHGIVFDAGVWTGQVLKGGVVHFDGTYIKRIENDPGSIGNALDSNDSTMIIMGFYDGLNITGNLSLEGFQVDTQAEGERGITSGDGLQISFGAKNITIDNIWAWKGTNAGVAINLNKRGSTSTPTVPRTGFDTRPEQQTSNIHIKNLNCVNGEHGSAAYGGYQTVIDNYTVTQIPYTYGGVPQGSYQQRGFYCLNADVRFKSARIHGVNHVALFVAVYDGSRGARDATVECEYLDVLFPTSQDADPDRYAACEMQNSNRAADGAIRTISVTIGRLRARNQKSTVVWRETNRYVSESDQILKLFRVDYVDGESILHGIYLKPRGGAGKIIVGGGTLSVLKNDAISTTVVPGDGLLLQAGALTDRDASGVITLATLNGYTYWSGTGPVPADYIKPGNIKIVSDWPGGQTTVIYDPFRAGTWASPAAWRPLEAVGTIGLVRIGAAIVTSACAPIRVSGVDVLEMVGTFAQYVEQGLPIDGDQRRCIHLYRIGACGGISYNTSDGLGGRQLYVTNPVPVPIVRTGWRVFARDFAAVPATSASAYVDYAVTGCKAGDTVLVTPGAGTDIGSLTTRGYCAVDGTVRVKLINPTTASITPPVGGTYTIQSTGMLA